MKNTTALDLLENIFANCLNNFDHNSWIENADDALVIAEGYIAPCTPPFSPLLQEKK